MTTETLSGRDLKRRILELRARGIELHRMDVGETNSEWKIQYFESAQVPPGGPQSGTKLCQTEMLGIGDTPGDVLLRSSEIPARD